MINSKIRVAYYDCIDDSKQKSREETEIFANWAINYIERNNKEEVVAVMIEIEKPHISDPYCGFIYEVIKGKFGRIDKVVMSSMKIFDSVTKLKLIYRFLKNEGISLEFIAEGKVDEKFIEAYDFVEDRQIAWEHRQSSIKPGKEIQKVIVLPKPEDDKKYGPEEMTLRCVYEIKEKRKRKF